MSRIVNRIEFTEIVGRSPRLVAKWTEAGMPAVRSGRGLPVEIDTAAAIKWLLWNWVPVPEDLPDAWLPAPEVLELELFGSKRKRRAVTR